MIQTAHFFWHGPTPSLYERLCLMSFAKHGFEVCVWTYQPFDLPEGVHLADASSILPAKELKLYSQGGKPHSIASFANFFRYKLLSENEGWWFDTDLICLKPCQRFEDLGDSVLGRQDSQTINNAVLKIDKQFAATLYRTAQQLAKRKANSFEWGEVGPTLLTRAARDHSYQHFASPESIFFPLCYAAALDALDPEKLEEVTALCQDAYTLHLWNEILSRHAIPKNMLPPRGSLLHKLFLEIDPRLKSHPSLPAESLSLLKDGFQARFGGFSYHLKALSRTLVAKWVG